MATRFKIHPAIGIARLGNSPDSFFLAPETPGGVGSELAPDGNDTPVTAYKDAQHRIRRQACRFRVFEYAVDASGVESVVREVTPSVAQVTWRVSLANTKAASDTILSGAPVPRNPGISAAQLEIRPTFAPIRGVNQRVAEAIVGKVPLGELRTDMQGRLLVLGGAGRSDSVPAGLPINSFANNPDWYDDVSDGPVDAELTFPDGRTENVVGGWVVVAPPDFAPGIQAIATLYDVARDAARKRGWIATPAQPSYTSEILPILQRVAQLRWVNQFPLWNSYPRDWVALGDPANVQARDDVYQLLLDVEQSGTLNNFRYTDLQRTMLSLWASGAFIADHGTAPPPADPAAALDRAALDQTVGGGFYPVIEAGILMTNERIYAEPFRLTRQPFFEAGASLTLTPGALTQHMALPWQADFLKCHSQWWPAQRPDQIFLRETDAQPVADWIEGIGSHRDLCARFWKLGFVVPVQAPGGAIVHLERERAPDMPHGGV